MIFQYQIDEINFNVFINSFDEFSKDINQLTFLILNFMDLNEKINSYLHFGGEIHLEKEYSLSIFFCKFSIIKYQHKKYEHFFYGLKDKEIQKNMSNNYNNKKIYQNKLIVTKDINKKNQIKQEIINKNLNLNNLNNKKLQFLSYIIKIKIIICN